MATLRRRRVPTLAAAAGTRLRWPVIRWDLVRKELAGVGPTQHTGTAQDTVAFSQIVAAELGARAAARVRVGAALIVDGTFPRPDDRAAFTEGRLAAGRRTARRFRRDQRVPFIPSPRRRGSMPGGPDQPQCRSRSQRPCQPPWASARTSADVPVLGCGLAAEGTVRCAECASFRWWEGLAHDRTCALH